MAKPLPIAILNNPAPANLGLANHHQDALDVSLEGLISFWRCDEMQFFGHNQVVHPPAWGPENGTSNQLRS